MLLVAPTGSGKTVMGVSLVGGGRTLWVAHRRELVEQALVKLGQLLGVENVNCVMPGTVKRGRKPDAPVQVGTTQTLLRRGFPEGVELLVLDEAHRYEADEYRRLAEAYPAARILGLTATPQRHDGRPLGDTFEDLVVAAKQSELIAAKHVCPLRVLAPTRALGEDHTDPGLAMDPVEAYLRYSNGQPGISFCSSVEQAEQWAKDFRAAGVRAGCIDGYTPKRFRSKALASLARGETKMLTSVYTLTEGLDVPLAAVVIIGRRFEFVGSYLQAVGRITRPSPGKVATVIDLAGAVHRHDSPNEDRDYSLEGRAILSRGGGGERAAPSKREPRVGEEKLVVVECGSMPMEWAPEPIPRKLRTRAEREYEAEQQVFKKHGARHAEFFMKYQARID